MKVHLYAQAAHHEDAYIVADAEGLQALRDACDAALRKGVAVTQPEAEDGEGYALFVANLETRDPKWDQLLHPYTLPEFNSEAYVKSRIGPFDVVGSNRYRELHLRIREENRVSAKE